MFLTNFRETYFHYLSMGRPFQVHPRFRHGGMIVINNIHKRAGNFERRSSLSEKSSSFERSRVSRHDSKKRRDGCCWGYINAACDLFLSSADQILN